MTTIATDGRRIAADGLVTWNDRRLDTEADKLFDLPDGSVVGWAGDRDAVLRALAFLQAHPDGDPPAGDYDLLRLYPSGEVQVYGGASGSAPIGAFVNPPQSIGSGSPYAMGAMLAGRSPKRAVEIAASQDIHTGGTIKSRKVRR